MGGESSLFKFYLGTADFTVFRDICLRWSLWSILLILHVLCFNRRGLARHLRSLMGPWWVSQFDPSREVAEAAQRSFQVRRMVCRLGDIRVEHINLIFYLACRCKMLPVSILTLPYIIILSSYVILHLDDYAYLCSISTSFLLNCRLPFRIGRRGWTHWFFVWKTSWPTWTRI